MATAIHVVCRDLKNTKNRDDGLVESGFWVVSPKHRQSVTRIYLHQRKSEESYCQGNVVGIHLVIVDGKSRTVFIIHADDHSKEWVGGGSGEKGYEYN